MEGNRLSDADRLLLYRVNIELAHGAKLQALITAHFEEVYKLQPGDRVEDDGSIVRGASSESEPTPLRTAEA